MKNFSEQKMATAMDLSPFKNQMSMAGCTGKGLKTPELDDVRTALGFAHSLASKVSAVEEALLGGSPTRQDGESLDTVHGVFPLLAKQSREVSFEMQMAENALDRILASI